MGRYILTLPTGLDHYFPSFWSFPQIYLTKFASKRCCGHLWNL